MTEWVGNARTPFRPLAIESMMPSMKHFWNQLRELLSRLKFPKEIELILAIVGAISLIGCFGLLIHFLFPGWLGSSSKYIENFQDIHPDLLMTIGASIVGIIAITFSLAIFSIQYAAEKGTSQILREYRDDKVYKSTFVLLCIFSIVIFIFSLLPSITYFTFLSYIISLGLLIATFFLLWRIFLHTIKLVNPLDRIQDLYNSATKYLSQLSKNIEQGIQNGTIDIPDDPQLDSQKKRDLLTTGVFNKVPALLTPVRSILSQVFDVMREYIPRRKYDVTSQGYRAVAFIVGAYFAVRKKSMESISIFNSQTDGFLTDIYEELSALYRASIGLRDLQSARQNLGCFQGIALQAISYPSILDRDGVPTVNMSTGYMKMNVVEGLKAEMDDLGLDGIRILRNIEEKLSANHQLTTNSIVTDIYDICSEGIIRRKFFIVQEGTSALVQIYHHWVKPYEGSQVLRRTIFDKLKTLAIFYVRAGFEISINCEGLSAIFNITNNKSIPYIFLQTLPEITPENFDADSVTDLFHLYREVGEEAGQRHSFLIHFIFSSIENIVLSALNIFGSKPNKEEYKKILNEFIWLVAVYWYTYEKYPEEYRHDNHVELTGVDNLLGITLRAMELGFNEFVEKMISQIKSIISIGIRKKSDEFTVPRLMENLIKIGIVARAKGFEVLAAQVLADVSTLQSAFLEKNKPRIPKEYFNQYQESLHREMWRIYSDFDEDREITPFDSDHIFHRLINLNQIMTYLNEIERMLYNREVTEPPRRNFGF